MKVASNILSLWFVGSRCGGSIVKKNDIQLHLGKPFIAKVGLRGINGRDTPKRKITKTFLSIIIEGLFFYWNGLFL